MLRKYKNLFGCLAGLALAHSAAAFTVWGPVEAWQTPDLDYIDRAAVNTIFGGTGVELGGSKILGVGSRVGVPVITYAFDYTFAEYFGEQGMQAVDQAMAIINGLPTASGASPGLTEFVQQGNEQINYTAQALGLFDLKSATLTMLLEHLGLQGETHVYDLSARVAPPNAPPCFFDYYVINRNYDPITYNPSTFVNGIQYGYSIVDLCPVVNAADADEYPLDLTQNSQSPFTAAATFEGQVVGGYYLNITRDDFGGLRWLYRKNHLVNEAVDPTSLVTSVGSSPYNFFSVNGTSNLLTSALFGGVEKVRFVKTPFDSILGTTFTPRTYNYSKQAIVNGQVTTVGFTRFITQPDIIFSTADLVIRTSPLLVPNAYTRDIAFLPPPVASTGGGPLPNVFLPQQQITYDNAFPIVENGDPTFLTDDNSVLVAAWGSFGSSSAAPIVYPNGKSILELEDQVLSGDTGSTSGSTTYNPYGFGFVTGGTVTFLGNY